MKATRGFESTYEELKLPRTSSCVFWRGNCFESTYEELKLQPAGILGCLPSRFESTYEELKHKIPVLLVAYLPGFESTYEELKQGGVIVLL